ncbi:MAG: hypothetical protein L3J95_06505 [Thermoplasmata archaeon]|nr:hypothetical protein [Thermoplasmata archaeon]
MLLTSALLLAVIVVPAASAAPAALRPASGSSSQSWAYGGQEWQNTTIISSSYLWHQSTFYGWQVVQTQKNTSSTVTQVSGVDTSAENYYFQYCVPNCSAPATTENESYQYWSVSNVFANLTSQAAVFESGKSVKAFGILNASSGVRENVSETYSGVLNHAPWYAGSYYYGWNSETGIAFKPALGLVPWNASKNQTWNSTSAYSASGGWLETYLYYSNESSASSIERANLSGANSNRGNESVSGRDTGNVTLSSGAKAQGIDLAFSGPYNVSNGLFIVPASAQVFGGATANWSVQVKTAASAFTVELDMVSTAGGARAVVSSATTWSLSTTTGSLAVIPSGVSTNVVGRIQAQPEPVPYAQATSKCLLGPCGPRQVIPTFAPGLAGSFWILAAAIVGAVGGAGGLWIARRSPAIRAPTAPRRGPSLKRRRE